MPRDFGRFKNSSKVETREIEIEAAATTEEIGDGGERQQREGEKRTDVKALPSTEDRRQTTE